MSVASLMEYENFRLKYVRMWCITGLIMNTLLQLNHQIQGKIHIDVWIKVFHWMTTIVMLIGVFLSYKRNIKTIYWTILLYQLRTFQGFMQVNDIFSHDEPNMILMLQMMVILNLMCNHFMILTIFTTGRNKISLVTCLAMFLGMAHKSIGLQNFRDHYLGIGLYCVFGLTGGSFYHYIYSALINLNMD